MSDSHYFEQPLFFGSRRSARSVSIETSFPRKVEKSCLCCFPCLMVLPRFGPAIVRTRGQLAEAFEETGSVPERASHHAHTSAPHRELEAPARRRQSTRAQQPARTHAVERFYHYRGGDVSVLRRRGTEKKRLREQGKPWAVAELAAADACRPTPTRKRTSRLRS